MTTDASDLPAGRVARLEGIAQIGIMLAIGGAAGAASFTHVHNVAAAHGQDGWLSWADAVVLELMSVASGLEMRHRKRRHRRTFFPALVLIGAVALSISAQVVEAERSLIGWIAAALPALGFLAMVKIALGRAETATIRMKRTTPAGSPLPSLAPPEEMRLVVRVAEDGNDPPAASLVESARHMNPATRERVSCDDRPETKSPGGDDLELSRDDGLASVPGDEPSRGDGDDQLLSASQMVVDRLLDEGRPVTRDTLAERLRRDGHAISNARVSALLAMARAESRVGR